MLRGSRALINVPVAATWGPLVDDARGLGRSVCRGVVGQERFHKWGSNRISSERGSPPSPPYTLPSADSIHYLELLKSPAVARSTSWALSPIGLGFMHLNLSGGS